MITVNFYSFLMTVFISNMIMLLLFLCCKSVRITRTVNLNILLFGCVLCLLRTCLPFEFHITKEINAPAIYNPIYNFLNIKDKNGFAVYHGAVILWTTVSLILLIIFIDNYSGIKRRLTLLPRMNTPQVMRIAKEVIPTDDLKKLRILAIKHDGMPKTTGVFKGVIMLPNRKYKDGELKFILLHEYTHYKNHDGAIKWITELLCILFWWFPALHLFKYGLESALELRCDFDVAKGKKKSDIRYYTNILIDLAKSTLPNNRKHRSYLSSGLSGDSEFNQRISMLVNYGKKRRSKALSVITVILCLVIFCTSFLFIFQSYYLPPIEDIYTGDSSDDVIEMIDDIYALDKSNDTYIVINDNPIKISEEEHEEMEQDLKR